MLNYGTEACIWFHALSFQNFCRAFSCIILPFSVVFPPPERPSISFVDLSSRHLSVRWNNVDPDCPALHYIIISSNCGSCPTTTTNTTVTCTDVPADGSTCTIAVKTAVCGDITGSVSERVEVILAGTFLL